MVNDLGVGFPNDTHFALRCIQVSAHFKFQATLAISWPHFHDFAFRRDENIVGNTIDIIYSGQSCILFQVTQVLPGHLMLGRSSLPSVFGIRTQTDNRESVFILFLDFFHFGECHNTRSATAAPKVKKHIFSLKASQMMNISVEVEKVGVCHIISFFHCFGREKIDCNFLSFDGSFLFFIQSVIQSQCFFFIGKLGIVLHRHT